MARKLTAAERFWSKVDKGGPLSLRKGAPGYCWIWKAGRYWDNYGKFSVDGQSVRAHRFAYEQEVADIPDGLVIDHLCRNPPCVNPAHLEPVTNAENNYRGISPAANNYRKTHCLNGHPYDMENTHELPNGGRACRSCDRQKKKAMYDANPEWRERVLTRNREQSQAKRQERGLRHNRNKTHCPQGHPYDDANTYVAPSGKRTCRECQRFANRAYQTRKRAAARAQTTERTAA